MKKLSFINRLMIVMAVIVIVSIPALTTTCHAWTVIEDVPDAWGFGCITATDSNHVWAGCSALGSPGVFFYNGRSWKRQLDVPTDDVFAVDENNVWAVSVLRAPRGIFFFDGSEWIEVDSGATQAFKKIAAVDANHVWFLSGESWKDDGESSILFYDGTSFKTQLTGPYGLTCIAAADENNVWAVGRKGRVFFFNGQSWSTQASGTDSLLSGVFALDKNHVWAVGGKGYSQKNVILFYDGRTWTRSASVRKADGDVMLHNVTALDKHRVFAVGERGTVACFDGSTWRVEDTTVGDKPLFDVCRTGGRDIWIAGGWGEPVVLRRSFKNYRYFFAEGTTREGFDEWLCLQNPGPEAVKVRATYMLFGGKPVEKVYSVGPTSRASVSVNDEVGPGKDVSVMLEGDEEFYAERPMYFEYKKGVPGFGWSGGHCSIGVTSPARDWYFAEGTTRAGFEEWICIQNPNTFDTEVTVDYIFAGAYTQQKKYTVNAKSRISVFVNGDVGAGQDLSVRVHSENPIVAERPVYFEYKGMWTGGHVVVGAQSPAVKWYFAEGTTRPGYEQYLAVQNANDSDANLTIRFLKTDGTEIVGHETVAANSRWTMCVNDRIGPGVDSSMIVESSQPVVAERPMYFSYRQGENGYGWTGGHNVVGATEARSTWHFAEGCTLDSFDQYICIGNPGMEPANARISFMLDTGKVVPVEVSINPKTRVTLRVWEITGRGHGVSTKIISNKPLVCERPMYFNYQGRWTGGHDVVGF